MHGRRRSGKPSLLLAYAQSIRAGVGSDIGSLLAWGLSRQGRRRSHAEEGLALTFQAQTTSKADFDTQIVSGCSARRGGSSAPYFDLIDLPSGFYARRDVWAPMSTSDGAVDGAPTRDCELAARLWCDGRKAED